jgi:hypothetical protein
MEYLTESTKPDIIIGNESWLNKDNRQRCFHLVIFLTETIVKLMHIFILVSKKYLSSDPSELKSEETIEQLWIKFQIKGSHDLYIHVGSFYKPPKLTDEEYLTHLEKK